MASEVSGSSGWIADFFQIAGTLIVLYSDLVAPAKEIKMIESFVLTGCMQKIK